MDRMQLLEELAQRHRVAAAASARAHSAVMDLKDAGAESSPAWSEANGRWQEAAQTEQKALDQMNAAIRQTTEELEVLVYGEKQA